MLRKIKEQVPKNFLIGVRISPEIEDIGISIDESIKLVKILKNEGVDFIHLSCWDVFKNSSQFALCSRSNFSYMPTRSLPSMMASDLVMMEYCWKL